MNRRNGCGIGKNFKRRCGRFTLPEMLRKLVAYAAAHKQKNHLIECSLKFLTYEARHLIEASST